MPQVVLITGCSTGIGRDLAQWLTQAGYVVVATARKPETLEGLDVALKLPLDVTRPESIHRAVDRILHRFGRIDVLVNEQYQNVTAGMRRQEHGPEAVSRVVQQAMEASRPKARYVAGFPFSGRLVLLLGDSAWDYVVKRMFKTQAAVFAG